MELKRWLILGFVVLWFSVYATWNYLDSQNSNLNELDRVSAFNSGRVSFYVYTVCGDSICSPDECNSLCLLDCSLSNCCGDGTCQAGMEENETSCVADCYVAPIPSPSGGTGGGGGGGIKTIYDFSINPYIIQFELVQSGLETKIVLVKNLGNMALNINLDDAEFSRFLLLSEKQFYLQPGQEKVITLDFASREYEIPDLYMGKIYFNANGVSKTLRVILELKSKKALFDLNLNLDEKYRYLFAGNPILGNIIIKNLGSLKPVDINLEYAIKDFDGDIYEKHEETLAVNNELIIRRELSTFSLKPGDYVYYTKITYLDSSGEEQKAVSSQLFTILDKKAQIPGVVCGDKKCSYTEWYSCPADCGKVKLNIAALLFLVIIFTGIDHLLYKKLYRKKSNLILIILNLEILLFVAFAYLALYNNLYGFVGLLIIMSILQMGIQRKLFESVLNLHSKLLRRLRFSNQNNRRSKRTVRITKR